MELVIGIIVALVGALFFQKKRADKAETERQLAETKAKDQVLAEQEEEVERQIAELDKGINKMKAQQEAEARKRAEDNMSLKERADRIKKGLS